MPLDISHCKIRVLNTQKFPCNLLGQKMQSATGPIENEASLIFSGHRSISICYSNFLLCPSYYKNNNNQKKTVSAKQDFVISFAALLCLLLEIKLKKVFSITTPVLEKLIRSQALSVSLPGKIYPTEDRGCIFSLLISCSSCVFGFSAPPGSRIRFQQEQ